MAEKRPCSASLRDGTPCRRAARPGEDTCCVHDPDRPRCGAHGRRADEPCDRVPMKGGDRCYIHGGASPQAKRKAAERILEERARKLVDTYGRKVETTATEALLEEVQWTAGHVAWLRERVQEVEQDALVWGKTQSKTGGQDWGETEAAVPNIWLKIYQDERAHLVKVCAEAIKAGIEERRVRLAEQQGALVAQAIRAILGDLRLTPEQQELVKDVVPRHLRALAA